MPWHVEKSGTCPPSHPWAVVKDDDGEVEGCHATREMAEEQMRALYAGEHHNGPGMKDRSWYRIANRADAAEIWLYDEVGKFGVTAAQFVADINAVKAPALQLRVNSPGGEVFDGMAIYNAIRNHPAEVTVHIDGLAASAASFIAMAGDKVIAERTATLMIHDGMGIAAGNSKDMRSLAELLDKCSDNIASIYAERAGGTVEQWRERMRAETWYTAAEAQTAGLVDEVVTGKTRISNSVAWDLSLFRYQGRAKAPDPFNHAPPVPDDPPDDPAVDDPPDEAGFLMPDIRGPLQALAEIDWDPELFRDVIAAVALDSPAHDRPSPPVPEPEPEPAPPPPEVAEPSDGWDPALFRAAVTLVAHDTPAPETPTAPAPQPAEPDLPMPDLRRAIREARL